MLGIADGRKKVRILVSSRETRLANGKKDTIGNAVRLKRREDPLSLPASSKGSFHMSPRAERQKRGRYG